MLQIIKKIFGFGKTENFNELIKNGALILDVRTTGEYASGHIQNSTNIPVDSLKNNLNKLKDKQQIIITCCASGMRSSVAKSILTSNGYINVYNGGGWSSLQSKMNQS